MRKYKVITLTPEFRVESLINGKNSLERATCLVEKNKKTLLEHGIPCSVFFRRVKNRKSLTI